MRISRKKFRTFFAIFVSRPKFSPYFNLDFPPQPAAVAP